MNPIFIESPSAVLTRFNHCKGNYFKHLHSKDEPYKITACCIVGALYIAAGWAKDKTLGIAWKENSKGEDLMNDVVADWTFLDGEKVKYLGNLIRWNDTHTKEEALQLLRHNGH